jgi:hypothetical protein
MSRYQEDGLNTEPFDDCVEFSLHGKYGVYSRISRKCTGKQPCDCRFGFGRGLPANMSNIIWAWHDSETLRKSMSLQAYLINSIPESDCDPTSYNQDVAIDIWLRDFKDMMSLEEFIRGAGL